jgi:hypothetical protein
VAAVAIAGASAAGGDLDPQVARAGWQALVHDSCRFAVPGSWHADDDASAAVAPDGSNISVRVYRIASWPAHAAQIKAAFGRVQTVHEDSDRRLWLEIADGLRVQHYIEVPKGHIVCSALLEIRPATTSDPEDTTRGIADSVGAP